MPFLTYKKSEMGREQLSWHTGSGSGEGDAEIGCVIVTHIFLALKWVFGKQEKENAVGKRKGEPSETWRDEGPSNLLEW